MVVRVRIKRFDKALPLPSGEPRAAGLDLYCREAIIIPPHEIRLVPANNAIVVPDGYFLLIAARSSTPWKKGLILPHGIGIVDPFFCGDQDEIQLQLYNLTDKPVEIHKGELLAQALLMKHESVQWQEVDTLGHDGHGGYHT